MSVIDKRSTVEHLNTGGSKTGLQVWLTAEEAEVFTGDEAAVAAWYTFATFEGGKITHQVEQELDEDEAGELTGAVIVLSDRAMLENVIKETSDAVEDLIDNVLSKSFHKYRYALPVVKTGATPKVKMYGFKNAIADKGWEINVSKGKRTRAFKLTSTSQDDEPSYVRATVERDTETAWPAALAPFKTTPA